MSTPFQLYYIMERDSMDSGAATNNLNHVDVESHIPKSVLWVAVRACSIATLRTVGQGPKAGDGHLSRCQNL